MTDNNSKTDKCCSICYSVRRLTAMDPGEDCYYLCSVCKKKENQVYLDGKLIQLNPDSRSERSFVTYKTLLRDKKELSLAETPKVGEHVVTPKWEKKRLEKKKNTSSRRRENETELLEELDDSAFRYF